ncbi:unnamed protein product [Chrysoparadoxa australica]
MRLLLACIFLSLGCCQAFLSLQAQVAGTTRFSGNALCTMSQESDYSECEDGDGECEAYENAKKSLWVGDGGMEEIFKRNREWVRMVGRSDPDMFDRLKNAQAPTYLYIGCSDSRVPAQNMLGLTTGELFVHRNIANLCINNDLSLLSVLTYAVEVLKVSDIIVCGHTRCGGIKASMENTDHGLLEHWLHHIRNVRRAHAEELNAISDPDARWDRLVDLNVQEQCLNLFANPIVQKRQAIDALPRIHGWVYDISTGLVKEVKVDFRSEIKKYRDIYRLYDFPKGE